MVLRRMDRTQSLNVQSVSFSVVRKPGLQAHIHQRDSIGKTKKKKQRMRGNIIDGIYETPYNFPPSHLQN